MYSAVIAVIGLSSIAPFMRLSPAGPRIHAEDVFAAIIYIVLWTPFAALLAFLASRRGTGRAEKTTGWIFQGVMFVTAPALHTILFLTVRGVTPSPGIEFAVLTLLGTLQYLVLFAVVYAIIAGRRASDSRAIAAELELSHSRLETLLGLARIDALRSQLQPHFLFNTLNSISVLMATDTEGARLMIRKLSDLLRAILSEDDSPTITLRRELELLEYYCDIQKVRFGSRLSTKTRIDPHVLDAMVPTLVLQPIVENAIQYSIVQREAGGAVEIAATRSGTRLIIEVTDEGTSTGTPADGNGGRGIGRANTAHRLKEIYGDDHAFSHSDVNGGRSVRIDIPLIRQGFAESQ